ncbi:MAG: CARDB domain-containing protein [Candidatus Scalinduaceae bacterium]
MSFFYKITTTFSKMLIISLLFPICFIFIGQSRADLPTTLVSGLDSPNFLTVDQNNVYWTETSFPNKTGEVKKVPIIGGAVSTVSSQFLGFAGGTGWTDIAVDNTSVYWGWNPGGGSGIIYKIPITGGVRTTLSSDANQPGDIAVDSAYVYWSDNNSGTPSFTGIRKIPINGGDLITLTTKGGNTGIMAIDDTHVYFSYFTFSFFTGTVYFIAKINKEGGSVIDLATNLANNASGIAVDESNVYWVEPNAGSVKKVPINGGSVTTLATGLDNPFRIAVDNNNLYFTEYANGVAGAGSIKKISINGGAIATLASGLNGPYDIVEDSISIYWTEKGTNGTDGAIMKLGKTSSSATTDFKRELAEHWAPVIYQKVDNSILPVNNGLNGRADFITNFDFDDRAGTIGTICGDDNWIGAEINPLYASVYYDVKETDTHWFIYYAVFHPRDWATIKDENNITKRFEHENDMEAMLFVIKKDGSDYGDLIIIESMAHNIWMNYPIGQNITVIPAQGSSDINEGVNKYGDHRYVAFIESRGHGIYFDKYKCTVAGINIGNWYNNNDKFTPGVVYVNFGNFAHEEPDLNKLNSFYDSFYKYDLIDIKKLWDLKEDPDSDCIYCTDSQGYDAFCGTEPTGSDNNQAHPPWTIPDYRPIVNNLGQQCPPIRIKYTIYNNFTPINAPGRVFRDPAAVADTRYNVSLSIPEKTYIINNEGIANNADPLLLQKDIEIEFNGNIYPIASSLAGLDILSLAWDFGDGGTGTGWNPNHTYNSTGKKEVKITANLEKKNVTENVIWKETIYFKTNVNVTSPGTLSDLTVLSVSVDTSSAVSAGSTIPVTFTVKNIGDAASGGFNNRISLATSAYGTQNLLANFSMASLAPNESSTVIKDVTIPTNALQGDYWITVYADGPAPGVVTEANENNNIGSTTPNKITVLSTIYTINTSASPSQGGTTSGDGGYSNGVIVFVVASANTGYSFANWTENGIEVNTTSTYTFTASANRTLVANFTPTLSHTLDIISGANGSPNPVVPRGTANLSVTAVDSLGHNLSYAWTASCPTLSSNGTLIGTATRLPSWIAPVNNTGSQQDCTIGVTVSDGQGLSQQSTYIHKVDPGGVTSLSIVDGIRLLEPPPYVLNGSATVDVTIKNTSGVTVILDRVQAIGEFKDKDGFVYERTWPSEQFGSPLSLNPGETYQYTKLLANDLPGLATTATVMIYAKFDNIPGQEPITNFESGGIAQLVFEVGHTLNITSGPSGDNNPVISEGTVNLSATATDSLGHEPSYVWTASCQGLGSNGSFSNPNVQNPTWMSPPNTTGSQQNCTIQVTVDDGQGLSVTGSYTQAVISGTVDTTGPVPTIPVPSKNPITEGDNSITISTTIDDNTTGNSNIAAAEYYSGNSDPGNGNGLSMSPTDGSFNSTSENVQANIDTSSWTAANSPYTVNVRGRDVAGNWGNIQSISINVIITQSPDIRIDPTSLDF